MKMFMISCMIGIMGIGGCTSINKLVSKITPEHVASVVSSERPFAESLSVLAEIGACQEIVTIAMGASESLKTPENGASAVQSCNNLINIGVVFIPAFKKLNPDGSLMTAKEAACANPILQTTNVADAGFALLRNDTCK